MTRTITIPWDRGTMTFNRDRLQTAYLLTLELELEEARAVAPSVVDQLRDQYRISHAEAIELAAAAKVCIRKGIEP